MTAKTNFIKQLATYLITDQTGKSVDIRVGLGDKAAHEWQALRAKTPLLGYPTMKEAVATLTKFLA